MGHGAVCSLTRTRVSCVRPPNKPPMQGQLYAGMDDVSSGRTQLSLTGQIAYVPQSLTGQGRVCLWPPNKPLMQGQPSDRP